MNTEKESEAIRTHRLKLLERLNNWNTSGYEIVRIFQCRICSLQFIHSNQAWRPYKHPKIIGCAEYRMNEALE